MKQLVEESDQRLKRSQAIILSGHTLIQRAQEYIAQARKTGDESQIARRREVGLAKA
jgi:hypothetical protein